MSDWAGHGAFLAQEAGRFVAPIPQHNPKCISSMSGAGPMIHSPLDGDHFVLRPQVPAEFQQIALLGSVEGGSGPLYWFVDDELVSSGVPGVPVMLDPVAGTHRLVAVDAEGRSAAVQIEISH